MTLHLDQFALVLIFDWISERACTHEARSSLPCLSDVRGRMLRRLPRGNEQAATKALYLAVRSLDPKGTGQQRWIIRWKPILNVLAVSFHDRMPETANL